MAFFIRIILGIGVIGSALFSGVHLYEVSKIDISQRCWYEDREGRVYQKDGDKRKPMCSTSMNRGTLGAVGALVLLGASTLGLGKTKNKKF